MKKSRAIWNYMDMLIQILVIIGIIFVAYIVAENLERYIYRYAMFPFIAFVLIFTLGILLGRGLELTKKNKPIGIISRKMAKVRKKKNYFIFSENGQTYTPHKEIIEDIKSGEIIHVKQFQENDFVIEEFKDVYAIEINDIVDIKMDSNNDEESK